jgi:acyl carrier protein
MPSKADLRRDITTYLEREFASTLQGSPLTETTPLVSSGLIDSLSMVSLKIFLEIKCQKAIPDALATAEAFDSVESILSLLQTLGVFK